MATVKRPLRIALSALAIAGICAGFSARGTILLRENFNYPAGTTLASNSPWVGITTNITVTTSNLQFPDLTASSPGSYSASVMAGPASFSWRPLTVTASTGVVYYSMLIEFTTQPGSYYIGGLLQSTNAPPGGAADDPLDLIDDPYTTGFKLGVRAMGTAVNYVTNQLGPLNTNTVYFVVMKYNFANGEASMYLDPQPGAPEPASPDAAAIPATVAPNLNNLYLRSGSSSAGDFLVSTVCVATTWSEATAGTISSNVISADGAMLNAYLNSFMVTNFWLDGYSVNWFTGATNGNGPNMTLGNASHCSVFAPAVADLLGIYLPHPPFVSDIDLANYQAQWFVTNTSGWIPIYGLSNAQAAANAGTLVMASYLSNNTNDSGHIAVLRASTWSQAAIYSFGCEECQSGESNYNDTNLVTGFNQHPGAFPVNIKFYGHTVNYPISPVWPVFTQNKLSNGTFQSTLTTIVGRPYQTFSSTNATAWTMISNNTNSNIPTNFFTTNSFSNPTGGATQKFYTILPVQPPQ